MRETKFKHTEVGLVPEDWEIVTLEETCDFPTASIDTSLFDSRFYITTDNLLQNCLGAIPYEGELTYKKVRAYQKGDVLVSNIRPNLRKTYLAAQDGGCSTDVIVLRPKGINSKILHLIVSTPNYANVISSAAVGTKMPRGDKAVIKSYSFALPPLPEQQRIASALSNVDGLLARLDKLIAKKQAIKKGTMQQLLTGRKRLPGFTEPWEEKRLDEVCEVVRGAILKSSDFIDGDIPVVAGGISIAGYHNKANRQGCSITISASGANAGYVAFYSTPIFASDCSTIQEGTGFSLKFIYYVLSNRQKEIYELQAGGAQPHIHPKYLNPLMVNIPSSLAEQRTIARILTHIDKEIDALRAERRKAEAIKQGMMQQLLTGKIRLI